MPRKRTIAELAKLEKTHKARADKAGRERKKMQKSENGKNDNFFRRFFAAYGECDIKNYLRLNTSDTVTKVKLYSDNDTEIYKLLLDMLKKCGDQIIKAIKKDKDFQCERNYLYKFFAGISEEDRKIWFGEFSPTDYIKAYVNHHLKNQSPE